MEVIEINDKSVGYGNSRFILVVRYLMQSHPPLDFCTCTARNKPFHPGGAKKQGKRQFSRIEHANDHRPRITTINPYFQILTAFDLALASTWTTFDLRSFDFSFICLRYRGQVANSSFNASPHSYTLRFLLTGKECIHVLRYCSKRGLERMKCCQRRSLLDCRLWRLWLRQGMEWSRSTCCLPEGAQTSKAWHGTAGGNDGYVRLVRHLDTCRLRT